MIIKRASIKEIGTSWKANPLGKIDLYLFK